MTTETIKMTRNEQLAQITGGVAKWYGTRRDRSTAERLHGVEWNGSEYVATGPSKLVRANSGTWGRIMPGTHTAAALTAAECKAEGVTPGPGNN